MYNGRRPGHVPAHGAHEPHRAHQRALHSNAEFVITERSPWSDYFVFARANSTGISFDTYAYTFSQIQNTLEDLVRIEATFVYRSATSTWPCGLEEAGAAEAGVPLAYMDLLRTKHEAMIELAQSDALAGQCHRDCSPVRPHPRLRTEAVAIDGARDKDAVHADLFRIAQAALPAVRRARGYQDLWAFGPEERAERGEAAA